MNNLIDRLVGCTFLGMEGLKEGSIEVIIRTDRGSLRFHHHQNCCERVSLQDFEGGILPGGLIHIAQERTGETEWDDFGRTRWTFYTIQSTSGDLDLRFIGKDNGYYSTSVDLEWRPVKD